MSLFCPYFVPFLSLDLMCTVPLKAIISVIFHLLFTIYLNCFIIIYISFFLIFNHKFIIFQITSRISLSKIMFKIHNVNWYLNDELFFLYTLDLLVRLKITCILIFICSENQKTLEKEDDWTRDLIGW